MAAADTAMTTREFAEASGIPAATIAKLIRQGKLKAHKKDGRWRIPRSELGSRALAALRAPATPRPEPPPAAATEAPPAPAAADRSLSIAEFAARTYLTEKGVRDWLKVGRIAGRQEQGEWRIPESSLESPAIRRLLRK